MGAVAWGQLAVTPFPIPAHQTGRAGFRHPAFRLASPRGTRRFPDMHVSQTQNAEFTKHHVVAEGSCAAPRHFVSPHEEVANAVGDVSVDRPIRLQPCAIAKVTRPTSQHAVELIAHLRPRTHVAGHLFFAPSASTMRRATDCISCTCGILSKYFDKSASTTSE